MIDLNRLAEPLEIGGVEIRNRVFLAPMSGITDEPFRKRA
jgi:tRNA-dihydrouridine synthase